MTITCNQAYRPIGILAIVIMVFTGCGSVLQVFEDGKLDRRSNAAKGPLEHAMAAYQIGDYAKAMSAFNALSSTGTGKYQRRTARLGEICCRLMLAETQSDYTAAVDMWDKFRETDSGCGTDQDLILLDPLIGRLSVLGAMRQTDPQPPSAKVATPTDTDENKRLRTEILTLKKKAAQADRLKRQLDAVVTENHSLKEKIKALETIDQNIQKKKTKISAPSE
jgi:hypothetical protein